MTSRSIPNRLKTSVWIGLLFFTISGASLLAAGLFAVQFGLDNDPGWGTGRILLTAAGAAFLALSFLLALFGPLTGWRRFPAIAQSLTIPPARPVRRPHLACLFSITGALLVIFLSLLYITSGTLTRWTPYSNYYNRLADAFLSGQVSLLESPSPELLAEPNPYDWRLRTTRSFPWDVSFYNGRFYLYWGPFPALLAVTAKLLTASQVDDQYLLFFFISGLAGSFAALLAWVRARYYPSAPVWTLLPLTALSGLSIPVFWLVNRPNVYETAIAGGQFFLTLGLYALVRALTSDRVVSPWLALAGFCWGAAVTSRLNLAPAILLISAVAAVEILRRKSNLRASLPPLLALGVPLFLFACGLGLYNLARFGSLLETGHRFQLTGPALPPNYTDVTSLSYVLPSLYSYLIRPLVIDPETFPYVFAPFIKESMWPFWINPPANYYYSEPVAGLLAAVPGFWLAFLPLLGWARRAWYWLNEQPPDSESSEGAPSYLWICAVGGALALFSMLLIFISTSMRYLADVAPLMALLSALGWWQALQLFRRRRVFPRILSFTAAALIVLSIAASLLVGFASGDQRFAANNPGLYQSIAAFFP